MSSALDEDTRQTLDAGRETAGAMLRSAQKDLQKVFIVFLVGFIGSFYALRLYVWGFLERITRSQMDAATSGELQIIAQTPFDVILLQAKIGLVAGIILGLPVFIYFSRDALRDRGMWPSSPISRWKLALGALLATVLFFAGLAYGYLVFFPVMFAFLANNALSAGFTPTYSIVLWAQFIFLLTLSFGLAAQLPLAMSGLAYAEIVPYETFRDRWRYAVVAMFAFGALFTPPDPFTQIMWAIPMLVLYGFSLYLTKVVMTAKRGSEQISIKAAAAGHWNVILGIGIVGGLLVYAFFARGGLPVANDLLAWMGSSRRLSQPGASLPVSRTVGLALWTTLGILLAGLVAFMYYVYAELDDAAAPIAVSDPADIDLSELDAAGIRAAPPEAFADLSEDDAVSMAGDAMDDGDKEKARAILERFDEAEEVREAESSAPQSTTEEIGDRASRASGTFLDEFTDGEKDEDDIGGYYTDIAFILDSLTSRAFRIAAVFGIVLAATFGWLYTGGIGRVFEQFLSQLPSQVTPESINVVALHPMEALIFEVKFSTLIATAVTFPIVMYYAWPALRERGFVRGNRNIIFGWAAALVLGLFGGFVLGYTTVAPTVISYLVADGVRANMIIAYRITNFFWLIFFTTAGIGILADVPVLMLLLNTAGVSYRTMRDRWREVTVGIMAFAAVATPADVMTMFLVTIPLMFAYGAGLVVLFFVTFGGRRDLSRWTANA
ncbi:twin-arginine translocase subunit TatC [Haloplanus aerogenes]|uniref:Sec-independent protein translocase protein TatC n=1 Tax=Haloplanus aerogenes TaxID=660522 RepID=A0A3M0CVD4_9EURY|nr:twin-arginine translocase subunit TatC [Haloplanus aerogenes]AZH23945.1 preprotein translocase subunit TatC [Haloplanus aerogenes]RMB13292.1 sec-independent protein translocase protein TatC [Haloplanus aerogenes]